MSWRQVLLLAVATLVSSQAMADAMTCRARVALNRVYDVSLDTESGQTAIMNDAGTTFDGVATRSVSGRDGTGYFFLATGFGTGIEVQIENGGQNRVALCLAANECYACRR